MPFSLSIVLFICFYSILSFFSLSDCLLVWSVLISILQGKFGFCYFTLAKSRIEFIYRVGFCLNCFPASQLFALFSCPHWIYWYWYAPCMCFVLLHVHAFNFIRGLLNSWFHFFFVCWVRWFAVKGWNFN